MAAISYDSPAVLKEFAARRGITFSLLADPSSTIIERFGLRQPEGQADATTFVTDAAGVIRGKHQEESIVFRRTGASILLSAGAPPAGGTSQETPYFAMRSAPSNQVVGPGQRFTLALDFDVKEGLHAYAPGSHSYRPLTVRLDPHLRVATVPAPLFPEPKPYVFRPLNETVPVYEGRFRVLQDVVMNDVPVGWAQELLDSPERYEPIVLNGTVEYQVCSDTVCFPPGRLPLRFELKLRPKDEVRARPELRRSSGKS